MAYPPDPNQPEARPPLDPNAETLMRRPSQAQPPPVAPDATPAEAAPSLPPTPEVPPTPFYPPGYPPSTPYQAVPSEQPIPPAYNVPGYPPLTPYPPTPGYPAGAYPPGYPPAPGFPPAAGYPPSVPYPPGFPPSAPYSPENPPPPYAPGTPSMPYPSAYPPSSPYPPGIPSMPYPPGYPPSSPYAPGTPSMPYTPGYPPSMPYPPGPPSMPYQPGMYPPSGQIATMAPPQTQGWSLAQPLPLWAVAASTAAALIFIIVLGFTGQDWAASGLHAGIAAAIVLIVVGIFSIVRLALGLAAATNPARSRQFLGLGIVTVLLLVATGAGLGLQNPLHRAQAFSLQQSKKWQAAIDQYTAAGEHAPGSADLAGVYVAWGESLQAQGLASYPEALGKFDTAINTYFGAASQVTKAQKDEISLYLAWGQANIDSGAYPDATQHLDALLKLAFCDAACQTSGGAKDAKAYYQVGQSQIKNNQCTTAVQTYQTLVQRFLSTPDGQQAQTDLKAPQQVTGDIKGDLYSTSPAGVKYYGTLFGPVDIGAAKTAKQQAVAASKYTALFDTSGTFVVSAVAPNSYDVAIVGIYQGITVSLILEDAASHYLVANVTPLCPTTIDLTVTTGFDTLTS